MVEETIPRFDVSGLSYPGEKSRIAVLGLGNILLSDEGVGPRAAAALSEGYIFSPSVDIIDGGTMGLDLLPLFQDRDRILIIDAVDFCKSPGHFELINGNAIPAVLNSKLSVHHIGLSDLLLATLLTRETPLDLCLVGIQPQSLQMSLVLTGEVRNSFDAVLGLVVEKLKEWKIESLPRRFFLSGMFAKGFPKIISPCSFLS